MTKQETSDLMKAGGPGSGRHPGGGQQKYMPANTWHKDIHDTLTKGGWKQHKETSSYTSYRHSKIPGTMYNYKSQSNWEHDIPGKSGAVPDGTTINSLSNHLSRLSK